MFAQSLYPALPFVYPDVETLNQLSLFCNTAYAAMRNGLVYTKNKAKAIQKPMVNATNLFGDVISTATFPGALVKNIGAAWQTDESSLAQGAYYSVPVIALLSFLVECAAKSGVKIALPQREGEDARQVDMKEVRKVINAFKTGAGTGYFTLTSALAVAMGMMELIQNVELSAVYVSNATYLAGFVAPCALVGVAHSYLDYTKPEERCAEAYDVRQCVEDMVNTLAFASTANSLITLILSPAGLSETGDVNPLVRLYLFAFACIAALGPMYVRKTAGESANNMLDYALSMLSCATLLLATFLPGPAAVGEGEFYTTLGTCMTLSALSMIAGFYFNKQEELQPSLRLS